MKRSRYAVVTTGLMALSACAPSPCDRSLPSSQVDGSVQLLDCWAELAPTTAGQMPTSGSATYRGYSLSIIDEGGANEDGLISDATLTANFAGNSIGGTLSNFSSDSHGGLSGTLSLTGGTISGPAYSGATVSGVLTDVATTDTLTVGASSSGAFFGNQGQLVLGDISGTATWSNIGVGQTIEGFIVAQD